MGFGTAEISLINQGAIIKGNVSESVISNEVYVEEGATIVRSVLMPGVKVGKNAYVQDAILGPSTHIKDGEEVNKDGKEIILIDHERGLQNE